MDESTALAVSTLRAVETADRARSYWSDDDRAWASRAAAQVVGADAPPAAFVGRRARLAVERLRERRHAVVRLMDALRWRSWVGVAIVALGFVIGVATDWIGGAQRINIVYSPVLPLVLWNLALYVALAAGYVLRYGDAGSPGLLRRCVAWLAVAARARQGGSGRTDDAVARTLAALSKDWAGRAGPLYAARAARILHFAAAALAAGVIASFYLRGLVLEYSATWESTFLDASGIRALLAAGYAPGVLVTRVPVPDVAHIAAMRAPDSENAADWLHLMAATLLIVVIVPRLALAAGMGVVERYRARHLVDAVDDPYYQRLLRGFQQGPVVVRALPYSFAVSPAAAAALEILLARSLGGNVTVELAPTMAYGDEDAALASDHDSALRVVLFNATATPEREAHGRFLSALSSQRRPFVVVVDESAWNARWNDDATRRDERRRLWRELAVEQRIEPVFVDLARPDVDAAEAAFDAAFAGPVQ
ncbi:MAG: DUF2868 domain-containing protein [Burkholderiales bacterium]|nr:DUF2868 domain-containing protein [Burkholderiales bacterium]